MFEVFFKTNYEKVKALFRFEGSKYFFSYGTKCYFAQSLPLNMTVLTPIALFELAPVSPIGYSSDGSYDSYGSYSG